MKMELPEIRPEERTPLVEALLAIIRELLDRNRQLEETVQQLRDEIAILKGQRPRPNIKPSRLESATPPSQEGLQTKEGSQKRPGSEKRSKNSELKIHDTVPLRIDDLPPGAVLKSYERFIVQDLEIKNKNILYLRARYELPGGGSVLAPLPAGVTSHYGPTLTAYILHQYYAAHVTQPLLLQELHDFGVDISAGQLNRILTEGKDAFHQEKTEMLATALLVSGYIGTDDTGARHQGHNGYCTAIGNDLFSYFESTSSKSRLNFLEVLQGPKRDYAINEMAVIYWKQQKLAAVVVEKLRQGLQEFAGETAWQARLKELAIDDKRHVRLASEGALLGGLIARGVAPDLGVLSDGAPQFVIFVHAACWIHAERPLARLLPHNEEHRAAIEKVRDGIWTLYQDLKVYRQQPDTAQKPTLEARFDTLCDQKSGYPSIDGVLKEMREHKADLLRVLERPELPLHNNGMESDIREYVKKRKISGGTRSDEGRRCRDTFTSLKKTCRKLGLNFWNYLMDRIRGFTEIPRLPDLIRQRASDSSTPSGEAVPA
jgi:hypothetical protein